MAAVTRKPHAVRLLIAHTPPSRTETVTLARGARDVNRELIAPVDRLRAGGNTCGLVLTISATGFIVIVYMGEADRSREPLALASSILLRMLSFGATLVCLVRFGFVAGVLSVYFSILLSTLPFTMSFSAWYAGSTLLPLIILLATLVYGFRTSLAGRPFIPDDLLGG